MSLQYDDYIKDHKDNVLKGFSWLRSNLPDVVSKMSASDIEVLCNHDVSKYGYEEYDAYDKYFYGGNRSYKVVEEFNKAWLHHIHNNPHHWQHWILINDDPNSGEMILEMPYCYIIEMICDWWAFSWKKESLHEIFGWYDEHKNYIKLHPDTRKTLESILTKIKNKLGELENDQD